MDNLKRFMSKVEIHWHECWEWHGSFFRKEYGDRPQFWMDGRPRIATRAGWELMRGEIPDGKMLCHKPTCLLKEKCVNPEHLYPGDQHANMADRNAEGRTSRWANRYNFVQTPELEEKVRMMRSVGVKIDDICAQLNIGRSTYYRMARRGVVNNQMTRAAARANYRKAAQAR